MRSVLTLGLVSAFAALAAVAVVTPACTVGSDCDFGLCALPTTGTPGGTGDGGTPVDPCIATPTSSACLDESGALFVSPNGAATNEGSRAKPVGSLATALARIDGKRRRIYVCEGTYLEDLAFTAVHAGVSVIGGLDCQWAPKASAKPIFGASATPGRAFGASGLALVDVAIEAKDATDGGSSVALFVSGGDVTLQRVRLAAGKGATGAAGKLEPVQFPLPDVLRGQNGDATNGGKEVSFACPGGVAGTSFVTKGGAGGSPGNAGASGEPLVKAANGGVAGPCNGPGTGGDGNPATEVAARGASAKTHGTLGPGGWTPADGEQGATGKPGQGGGGGFGLGGGGGGGGGAGGCGGAGGGGGKGGGASIALAILGAKVTVGGSTVRADTGGPGGPGVGGQPGMPQGGARGGSGVACSGGSGAPGNPGGAGGGGAGGISVGILSSGATVVQPDAQNAITAGAGGAGGLDGTAESRAVDGLSEAIRSL